MLTMAEKIFFGLAITLSVVFAGIVVLPAFSYEVSLVTSPNEETFNIPAGKPFNITCRGSGDDAEKFASLKWLNKEGQVIPKGLPGTQEIEKNSLTLTFIDPKENESGLYKCMAVYEKRQILQKSVSITFHSSKPFFDEKFENVTARKNSLLEIVCAAEGESPITYQWYDQTEEQIPYNSRNSTSSIYFYDIENAIGEVKSILTIPKVTLNHTGIYTCLARNSHGLSSKIFQLTVLPEYGNDTSGNDTTNGTASFRGASVVNVTATSVQFAFDVTGPVEYIEVLYNESRNEAEYFNEFKYGDDYEIKDLIPARLYSFKFRAYPSENDEWSRPYQVVLLPDKPDVIFRTMDSGTVKFEWDFKFEDRNTIDRHEITYFSTQRYQTLNGTNWKPSGCPITIRIPACGSSAYTISGLSRNVYYEIQVKAHTTTGYGEPYTQKLFF